MALLIQLQIRGGAQQASDNLGKLPLGIQQLALARQRAVDVGDKSLAAQLGSTIDGLLSKIDNDVT